MPTVKELKLALYRELHAKREAATDNELDIMYSLAIDEEVRPVFAEKREEESCQQ